MPKFRFEVDLGTELKSVAFQEVSGMDVENQIIEASRHEWEIELGDKAEKNKT